MKLTKKIVSLAAVLALSCTFAVSAAPTVAINGDIAAPVDGTYSVNLTTTDVVETNQYTVLVYRVGDNGIMDTVATATLPAPSNTNITYINQDAFSTIKLSGSDAYSIAFALGAVKTDGVYKVMVGGTGVATAAVGYFEVGAAAPAGIMGDINGDKEVTPADAADAISIYFGAKTIDEATKAIADVNKDGEITPADAADIISAYFGAKTLG